LYLCDTNIVTYFSHFVKTPETEEFFIALFFDYAVQILNCVTTQASHTRMRQKQEKAFVQVFFLPQRFF